MVPKPGLSHGRNLDTVKPETEEWIIPPKGPSGEIMPDLFPVRRFVLAIVLVCALLPVGAARAVILYSSQTRNAAAPRGSLANSGWQWEGQFGNFMGTAISKKYIITASHFDPPVGTSFDINGEKHRTVAMWDDPNSDLRIFKCVGSFTSWAPIVNKNIETNRVAMMFGRGTSRGDDVMVNGQLHGWQWGVEDHVQSWGRNLINGFADGGAGIGQMLQMNFDATGVGYEGAYSRGDSGAGLFIKFGTKWMLAGVAYSADGPFSFSTDGSNAFDASIFDRGGLWSQSNGFIDDQPQNFPGASYASRLFSNLNWINGVLSGTIAPSNPSSSGIGRGVPEPSGGAMALTLCVLAGLAYRRRRGRVMATCS
jgi:hypothetical protein